jgi:hypothetical protein
MYLILVKMTKHFGTNQLFPLLKYMINISYHTLYQPSLIYHPLSLSALGLISWPRADKGYDMKNAM